MGWWIDGCVSELEGGWVDGLEGGWVAGWMDRLREREGWMDGWKMRFKAIGYQLATVEKWVLAKDRWRKNYTFKKNGMENRIYILFLNPI